MDRDSKRLWSMDRRDRRTNGQSIQETARERVREWAKRCYNLSGARNAGVSYLGAWSPARLALFQFR